MGQFSANQYTEKPLLEDRFWAKVDRSSGVSGCWIWTACINETGYGKIGIKATRQSIRAHRLSWEMHNGPIIPESLCVLHRCDNRKCVNPAHLFLGTRGDNNRDAASKGRKAKVYQRRSARAVERRKQADEIRAKFLNGGMDYREIAEMYGLTPRIVYRIVIGETWL